MNSYSCEELTAEGRTVPLWFTIILAAAVVVAVGYNAMKVKTSDDVIRKLEDVNENAKQDRQILGQEVKAITDQVGRIEERVNEAHENFLTGAKIIELVNENTAFPWHEEREAWLESRTNIDERTLAILEQTSEDCPQKEPPPNGNESDR